MISHGKDKGKLAVLYVTYEFDKLILNTLVDSDNHLNLYTLADPDLESGIVSTSELDELGRLAVSGCDACNCVLWVRCARASWLPNGLTTLADKKRAINTTSASAGRVAVHDIYYPYGHVSYVTKINGSTIYIDEANYSRCKVTSRSGSKSSLKIIGYIKR